MSRIEKELKKEKAKARHQENALRDAVNYLTSIKRLSEDALEMAEREGWKKNKVIVESLEAATLGLQRIELHKDMFKSEIEDLTPCKNLFGFEEE